MLQILSMKLIEWIKFYFIFQIFHINKFSNILQSTVYSSMIFTTLITVMHGLVISLESRETKPEIPGMNA